MIKGRVVGEVKSNSLPILEHSEVLNAINYLKEKVPVDNTFDLKSFDIEYFDDSDESKESFVEQTTTYMKLSNLAHIRAIATKAKNGNESFNVSTIHLGEKEGVPRVFITSFENGEIIYTVDKAYDENEFKVPQEKEDVEPFIAYLDCVWGNSCCTLKGVKYKWCGAGCGSGTPVNALDTCCKWHDNCYKANKSYPARCACDKVLNACADQSGVSGAGVLIAAFIAKMVAKGC